MVKRKVVDSSAAKEFAGKSKYDELAFCQPVLLIDSAIVSGWPTTRELNQIESLLYLAIKRDLCSLCSRLYRM